MKYYRVKKEYADKQTYIRDKNNSWKVGEPLYADALFTPAERAKMYPNVKDSVFNVVDIPKNRIYYSFGLRFANPDNEANARLLNTTCLGYPYHRYGTDGLITDIPLWGSSQKIYILTENDKFVSLCMKTKAFHIPNEYLLISNINHQDLGGKISPQKAIKILTNPNSKHEYSIIVNIVQGRSINFAAKLPYELRPYYK